MDWSQTIDDAKKRILGNVLSYEDFLFIERSLPAGPVLSKVSQAITAFEKEQINLLRIAVQERIR